MKNKTSITITPETRTTLMNMKYALDLDTIEDVIKSLIEISTKVGIAK